MESITLTLTGMANGGAALGRDENQRVIFVPQAIPGETVRISILENKKRFARGSLIEVLDPAPERVEPRCPHFGACGGCHFQHIQYSRQLRYKEAVIRDQLQRIGGIEDPQVSPVWPNPEPWAYANSVTFSQAAENRLGFWSPQQERVIPIDTCLLIRPRLLELYEDLELDLPALSSLTLRIGHDGELLALFQADDLEPPSLEADFPVSAALLLPDGAAASLIGDNVLLQQVAGRIFRVSAGCFFHPSQLALEFMVETAVSYAALNGDETVLELYSGVGTLTAFLAARAAEVVAVEISPDAVTDASANLADFDNITLYEGRAEEIMPLLEIRPDLIVVDPPPGGLPVELLDHFELMAAAKVLYVSSDIATLARDGRRLMVKGYRLDRLQPIDMQPQTYHVQTVSLWSLTTDRETTRGRSLAE
jgi:23S rRNA (uracil1939-C5)-methyltransferase